MVKPSLFTEPCRLKRCAFSSFRKKPTFENADVVEIRRESFLRTAPACPHFGVCGGCAMQHLEAGAQVAAKQRVLEDNLKHIGRFRRKRCCRQFMATWGYRHRARLSVKNVIKKNSVLVGFHEKRSSFIADMQSCRFCLLRCPPCCCRCVI